MPFAAAHGFGMTNQPVPSAAAVRWTRTSGLHFVLLFGVVNLFADMTYEGARSIAGPFLASLGASGLMVGSVTGFGEFLGYALRLVSGPWADRSRLYWPISIAGYIVQMLSVPALALARIWPVAGVLIVLERSGRAIRNPPRDVMLAEAGEVIGRGWAFGVNEGLDQLGAFTGPLLIAGILAWRNDYQLAFAVLAVPAVLTLAVVFGARLRYPEAGHIGHENPTGTPGRYPAVFWIYCSGAALAGFGFADYSLIAYHFSKAGVVPQAWIPIFYSLSMAAAGVASLAVGRLFDRWGLFVLIPITIVVAAYAPLAFLGGFGVALAGVLLWGAGLGVHESVMQAAVAHMIPKQQLGSAYGVFGVVFGIAWFAGSAALGAAYDHSPGTAALVAAVSQLLAVVPLFAAALKLKP